MNTYKPYEEHQLHQLINDPQEICDRPYMLHAAFALSCLYEALVEEDKSEDYEESDEGIKDPIQARWKMFGTTVPTKTLQTMIKDICEDFIDCAVNYKPIQVWGRKFNIRKTNAFDRNRLPLIFDFPIIPNGDYMITNSGVLNLAGDAPSALEQYETTKEEARMNREYFRKIVTLAEDDAIDGWDKLTDMEVVYYCWGLFYNKKEMENLILFLQEYEDYIAVDTEEIISCFDNKSAFRGCPIGMYPFSAEKIEAWNTEHRQVSKAKEISAERANDYWYEVALNGTFKK